MTKPLHKTDFTHPNTSLALRAYESAKAATRMAAEAVAFAKHRLEEAESREDAARAVYFSNLALDEGKRAQENTP